MIKRGPKDTCAGASTGQVDNAGWKTEALVVGHRQKDDRGRFKLEPTSQIRKAETLGLACLPLGGKNAPRV